MLRAKTLITAMACLLWKSSSVHACVVPDLANCTTTYTHSLTGSAITNRDPYCRVLKSYYNCIQAICGTIPKDMIDYIVNAQSHYFDCGISIASVTIPSSLPLLLVIVLLPRLLAM